MTSMQLIESGRCDDLEEVFQRFSLEDLDDFDGIADVQLERCNSTRPLWLPRRQRGSVDEDGGGRVGAKPPPRCER